MFLHSRPHVCAKSGKCEHLQHCKFDIWLIFISNLVLRGYNILRILNDRDMVDKTIMLLFILNTYILCEHCHIETGDFQYRRPQHKVLTIHQTPKTKTSCWMSHVESTSIITPNKNADIVRRGEAANWILAMHLFFLQVIPNCATESKIKTELELIIGGIKGGVPKPHFQLSY